MQPDLCRSPTSLDGRRRDPQDLRRLLHSQASEEPELEERARFLDRACGSDDELRNEVDSLLARADDADRLLENDPVSGISKREGFAASSLVGRSFTHLRTARPKAKAASVARNERRIFFIIGLYPLPMRATGSSDNSVWI